MNSTISEGLLVVAFRLTFRPVEDEDHLVERMVLSAQNTPRTEGSFYVYPGLLPMGLLPDLFRMEPEGMAERVQAAGSDLKNAYDRLGRALAMRLRSWVLPGSVLVPGETGYRHIAAIFSPEGEKCGEQGQTHAFREEIELEVSSLVTVIPVGGIQVGILLGADPWVPEVSRVMALRGAEILVAPLAPRAPYTAERAVAGLWQEVQQNQVFGCEAGLTGLLFDTMVEGKLGFMGPCEITPGESGFFEGVGYQTIEGPKATRLDPAMLRKAREANPLLRQMNPGLYRRYFPQASWRDGP